MPTSRKVMFLAPFILGSLVFPPGNSASKSEKLVGCRCSIAVRSIFEALVIPFDSEAVTTTSRNAVEDGFNENINDMLLVRSMDLSCFSYPI